MADEVVQTPFGQFLIDPADVIGSTIKAGTLWDGPGFLQPIALEYGRLGEAGATILDVGANIGTFTIWLCQHRAWRVVAVEPLPEAIRYLKANFDLNKDVCADRVVLLQIAAYDRDTHLTPVVNPGWSLGSTPFVPAESAAIPSVCAVPLDRYDWLYGDRVSLIKIDAQGCDGAVLMGLKETIQRDHPAIVFEWEEILSRPHGWPLPLVLSQLHEWGYEAHRWPSHSDNYLAVWKGSRHP